MKRIITISLLASASLLTINHGSDLLSTFTGAGAGSTAPFIVPSTLERLESFLRTNCGDCFPNEGFPTFCAPFKDSFSKLSRIDQLRAKNAAVDTIGQMVALAYYSFTQVIESHKKAVPYFADIAASREDTMKYYRSHVHCYFLKFQQMITQTLQWAQIKDSLAKDAKAALSAPYGQSSDLGIAWLRDKNGIVPVPLDGKLKEIIYSSSTPYGDWGDLYQRSMVFVDGGLITAPCIHVSTSNNGNVFKFVREGEAPHKFVTSPITMRIGFDNPIVSKLLEENLFRAASSPGELSAAIKLPSDPYEDEEFEAVFLEELKTATMAHRDSHFAEAFLNGYLHALEDKASVSALSTTSPDALALANADDPSASVLEIQIDSLYDDLIQAEQAAISLKVAEGSIAGKAKSTKKTGKAVTEKLTSKTPPEPSAEEKAALRREILEKFKIQGRIKWRALARIIISALKSAYADDTLFITVTEKGSHFMLHMRGQTGRDGITVVRPHGKSDRTISAGETRNLADKLIELTFRLMRK